MQPTQIQHDHVNRNNDTIYIQLTREEQDQWESKNAQAARTAFERKMAKNGYTLIRFVGHELSFTINFDIRQAGVEEAWKFAKANMSRVWQECLKDTTA